MVVIRLPSQRAATGDRRDDWWPLAACRDVDPDLFFPVTAYGPGAGDVARAKALCAACLVRTQCLEFALATHQMHGVWGGLTEDERLLRVRGEREQIAVAAQASASAARGTRPQGRMRRRLD